MSWQKPTRRLNWSNLWFVAHGISLFALGAAFIVLWRANRYAASHGGHDLHTSLPAGAVLCFLAIGVLCRSHLCAALASLFSALSGVLAIWVALGPGWSGVELLFGLSLFIPAFLTIVFWRFSRRLT